jgi:hypothetical protein
MKHWIKRAGIALVGLAILAPAIFLVGCSTDQPVQSTVVDNTDVNRVVTAPPEGQVQFTATVATTDAGTRTLTFDEVDYVVVAAEDCEIARMVDGEAVTIAFEDIIVGDYIKVCGLTQDDGSVLAHRIRVYCEGCANYDVAFRDKIATIDYTGMSFTVEGRTETIFVDENTLIWTTMGSGMALSETGEGGGGDERTRSRGIRDVALEFTDLAVGNTVEVRAVIEGAATLRAVMIKVAAESYRPCLEFDATIATLDYDTRDITFDGLDWDGWVCPSAVLTDADDNALLLEDFGIGDAVSVKGRVQDDGTLLICYMSL